MKIISDVTVRCGRISDVDNRPQNLSFEPGFQTITIPGICGLKDRKLGSYIHYYMIEKALQRVKDLNSTARAFLSWAKWLEMNNVSAFEHNILRYRSPTYGYRQYLVESVSNKSLASSTAAVYINVIKSFYEFLQRQKQIIKDKFFIQREKFVQGNRKVVSSDLAIRVAKSANSSLTPLTTLEQQLLTEVLSTESESFRLIIKLMICSGLRLDEVLTLPSVLFSEDKIAKTPITEEHIRGIFIGPRYNVHTKFGIHREMFITRNLYEQILDYIISPNRERKITKWLKLNNKTFHLEPIFVMNNGRRMTKNAFYSKWYALRKKISSSLGNKKFDHKPHDLRATFATEFLKLALDSYPEQAANALGTVKYWMGHRSEATTMKYIVFIEQNKISDAVACVMDGLLNEVIEHTDNNNE